MTEAELIKEIETEERGEDPFADATRSIVEAETDFDTGIEKADSVTTEAELVRQINEEAA